MIVIVLAGAWLLATALIIWRLHRVGRERERLQAEYDRRVAVGDGHPEHRPDPAPVVRPKS